MKQLRIIITFSFLLVFTSTFVAQSDSLKKEYNKLSFEAGGDIIGVNISPGDFYSQYHTVTDIPVFSGVFLKIYKDKNALRLGLNYSHRTQYQRIVAFGPRSDIRSLELRAGYQHMLSRNKLRPYVYTDLEFVLFSRNGEGSVDLLSSLYYYGYHNYNLRGAMYCITPGLGLRWQVYKTLHVNVETGGQLFYMREGNGATLNRSLGINAKALKLSMAFTF